MEFNRKSQLEDLLTELYVLNKEIQGSRIICKECGSDKIIYTNNNVAFDISNITVRNKIIQSIKSQIDLKNDLINEYFFILTKEMNSSSESFRINSTISS